MTSATIIQCDSRKIPLADKSVNCCVTSPPYYGLRDYGVEGQIGLEQTPEAYVQQMVDVFREVKRVLKDDGTLWLNLGDSYAAHEGQRKATDKPGEKQATSAGSIGAPSRAVDGLPAKNLIGIPWRVAFALQSDGWILRQDIIWHKPNPMPESVKDRCTKAHEYIFLLSKSPKYFFDNEAIKEQAKVSSEGIRFGGAKYGDSDDPKHATKSGNVSKEYEKANKRSVWTVATRPYKGAHFATFPPKLIEPCILAGCPKGGVVLDPFSGSGTTAEVAMEHGRSAIGLELNPAYIELSMQRLARFKPKGLFAEAV